MQKGRARIGHWWSTSGSSDWASPVTSSPGSPSTGNLTRCIGPLDWRAPSSAIVWAGCGIAGAETSFEENRSKRSAVAGNLLLSLHNFRRPAHRRQIRHGEQGKRLVVVRTQAI